MIINAIKAFKAEWLKLKNSGVFWIVLIFSLFIPLLYTTVSIVMSDEMPALFYNTNQWESFLNTIFSGFASFFYPIFLILLVARVCQIEHRSNGWKLIETQPIHRFYLYFAKFKIITTVSFICLLSVLLLGLLGGYIFSFTQAGSILKQQPIPLGSLLFFVVRLWVAGFGIIGLQYLLSIQINNFAIPFVIGFVATIAASILSSFDMGMWQPYVATSLTSKNYNIVSSKTWLLYHEYLSVLWCAIFLFIGFQIFNYKSFVKAFIKPIYQPIKITVALVLFAVLFNIIKRPNIVASHKATVFQGVITTKDSVKQQPFVYLYNYDFTDTIAVIPVKNNSFKAIINKPLVLGEYYYTYGNNKGEVIMGNNDSVFVQCTIGKKYFDSKILGTRYAENICIAKLKQIDNTSFYTMKNLMESYTPEKYIISANKIFDDQLDKLNNFTTPENIKPKADFIQWHHKNLMIDLWELVFVSYPKKYSITHPNEVFEYPKDINNKLKNYLTLNDSTLLNCNNYNNFSYNYIRKKLGLRSNSFDTSIYQYIIHPKQNFSAVVKNNLLYNDISSAITNLTDSSKLSYIVKQYVPYISNNNLQKKLIDKYNKYKNFRRGGIAPNFEAENILGQTISLSDLKGKFVMIDVWATWCGPCVAEKPYFEDFADKLSAENLLFVSLSVDNDKAAWLTDVKGKNGSVYHLWLKNSEQLLDKYGIQSIPRFILINPDGKFVSIDAPRPSEYNFESFLLREAR